ncbi:Tekt4p [Sparganum proliferum]
MNADDFTRHTDAQTQAEQHESTKSLRDNLHDLNFTERELEVEIKEIIEANSKLIATGLTLEKALQATEPSENISIDNINIRNRRRSEENVNDEVQHALIKELDIIAKSQNLLKRSISQVRDQLRRNRTAKENLELVVSNKLQAIPLDTAAGILKNQSTNKQFFPAVASLQEHVSSPAERSQEAHDAILAAEYERMASDQLDQLCRNIVHDVAEDMEQQADKVTNCILRNVDVLEAAEVQLKSKLNEVLTEMKQQQENIDKLHIAIRAKDDPVKVVQTRLHLRRQRCGMDCCEDIPHTKLVSEIKGLADTMDGLLQNLQEAEERMAKLEKCQMKLEQEICLKQDSIRVDKIQVLPKRSGQPSYIRRLGRVNAF